MTVFRRVVAAVAVTAFSAAASMASAEPVRPGASLVSPSATSDAVAGTRQGMRTGAKLGGGRSSAAAGNVLLFAALGIGAAAAIYFIVDDDKSSPD